MSIKIITAEEAESADLIFNATDVKTVDERRWSTIKEGIVALDGKHWFMKWESPATELQEDGIEPFERWNDEVTLVEAEQREVTETKWVAVFP